MTYFPPNFDQSRPIGLIAGRGDYPELMAESLRQRGLHVRLIGFEDETRPELVASFAEGERRMIHVGQLGKMLKTLESFGCGYAVMAGQITPKRLFQGLRPDLKALSILMSLKRKNAETIFGAIAKEIEGLGIHLLDARVGMEEQIATEGWMTPRSEKLEDTDIAHGVEIAREMARLDVGQGVVVRKGTVLAVEAYEGTDEMLRRAGTFKTEQLIFVKTVKARQDYRFDVPCFGSKTLEVMREAGIGTAALAAGSVLMLDKPRLLEQARAAKIQILGFS
jgi:UDP-2,3-diacylglucosamine hydrolase